MLSIVAACALVLGTWTLAWAHATLVRAEPAAGSRLATSPSRVWLLFSEALEPTLAHLTLVAPDGGVRHLVAAGDPHDVHALIAPVDALAPGAYRLLWHVVSADGHPVEGSYVFTVGAPSVSRPPPAPPAAEFAPTTWGPAVLGAPLVPALLRGLGVGALMGLVGLLTLARSGRGLRLASGLAVAAFLLLALHLGAWLMNVSPQRELTGDWVTTALASGVGRVELWRTGLALLALWALGLARRPRLALAFAWGALLVSGAVGHSMAMHAAWAVPAKVLHLAAGACWLGGLLWLIVCAPLGRDGAAFVREAERVSAIALVAVVLVALSGAAQALLFLPTPIALVRSAYGAVTLAKVVGLLALAGFGAYHRFRVLPRLERDRRTGFGGALRAEVLVMAVVILLGGLLAYIPPPAAPGAHAASTSAD
ncbi:copper resistance protein CopC (plasmid) [Gemmatirosa kalamazoonensis]|uniref:Copper resistance protein CopC n=1 Tax=Gemmatirosa kalamazoonensis TaxID=861299 RepID=W0RMI1_9BACT|nr:copper resistance protein CopC [Gemmatirosa kalamazoonensis]